MTHPKNDKARQLAQREKQILIGKNTREYSLYVDCVPKELRNEKWSDSWHPQTPKIHEQRSIRSFQGVVRNWRRHLHNWGNLPQETYEFLKQNPAFFPPAALERTSKEKKFSNEISYNKTIIMSKQMHRNLMPSFSVPPLNLPEILREKHKTSPFLEAAISTCETSKLIASNIFLCSQTHFKDSTVSGLYITSDRTKRIFYAKLPVAFIPLHFRSLQIWPSCLYLREWDFQRTIIREAIVAQFKMLPTSNPLESTRILGMQFHDLHSFYSRNCPFSFSTAECPQNSYPKNMSLMDKWHWCHKTSTSVEITFPHTQNATAKSLHISPLGAHPDTYHETYSSGYANLRRLYKWEASKPRF